ncbi:sugar isomerase [Haematobacter massiliensis]|uniref:Sugar isomerase n=1 Tax=Haematobacter massiliensis TaxID=195105 RepID=A0A086Y4Y8_9RHOB|nr:AGE family epimerase/isomerase [Haematobacter massiliensis]KFI29338.1 sugar isomerase [Haematobacter massiliensis]OWJ69854.1 sugar isomerase [Haematobacter massiliensis]OWJ83700.1 sugar isomerase [Haematobacter massiliensis]
MSRSPSPPDWLDRLPHRRWLEQEAQRLLDFSKPSRVSDGFVALDSRGRVPPGAVADTVITARMTHCYALAALQGIPGAEALVAHGVAALNGPLRDTVNGGWWATAAGGGRKFAYLHAFVALGACSAVAAGAEGAEALLAEAAKVLETRFWSEEEGVLRESFASDWSGEEDYRGANSNMHGVEAMLALADIAGQPFWRDRALRVAERLIHGAARANGYRLPEHYGRDWSPIPDYNIDRPWDDLRPFGTTPGHAMEWAHLLLKLEAALLRQGAALPAWLLSDAVALFDTAVADGWAADDLPGLVYTLDWAGRPSIANRAHWVQAEAVVAAATLHRRTGELRFETWYRRLWDYIDLTLIDRQAGGWLHEVDAAGNPTERIYRGKADLYHAYQALLAPVLPLAPCYAAALVELPAPRDPFRP